MSIPDYAKILQLHDGVQWLSAKNQWYHSFLAQGVRVLQQQKSDISSRTGHKLYYMLWTYALDQVHLRPSTCYENQLDQSKAISL